MHSYATEYHAEQGVRPLDAHAVFSTRGTLTFGTPVFSYIHVLGLLTHYRGSLEAVCSENAQPVRYRGALHGDFLSPALCSGAKEHLGLTFGKGPMCKFGLHGGSYARLLGLLGFSTSDGMSHQGRERNTKAVRPITLPSYLTSLLDNYASFTISERRLARPYLRDWVNIFLSTRKLDRKTLAYEASLFSQPTLEGVYAQATPLCKVLALLYPAAFRELAPEEVLARPRTHAQERVPLYGADFVLPLQRLVHLPLNHRLCIGLRVHHRTMPYYHENREAHEPN
jgi:hypothetical protein